MEEILSGIALAVLAVAFIWLIRSFYRVEEGHSAILTSFGKILRLSNKEPRIIGPGLHLKKPWQRVHEFSVMERLLPIREGEREVELLARDGTLLRLDPQVRFRFDTTRVESFVFGMKKPTSHLRELFRSLISAEIAHFGTDDSPDGSYAEIRRNRTHLQSRLQRECSDALEAKYGISFKSAEIAEILPPADLAQALNSAQKIEAENETLLNRFQAECEQQIAQAEHGVQIATMKASATENEINLLGGAINQLNSSGILTAYVKRRRDEVTSQAKTLYLKT